MPSPATTERRPSGRHPDELRAVQIVAGWLPAVRGSALVRQGATWVSCTCLVEERVPAWRKGSGAGWLTASYAMLPGAGGEWKQRERGAAGGRTLEIERLVGRTLRSAVDLKQMPEWTVHVDCDVLQADGGTRTAAITAGWVAVSRELAAMAKEGRLAADPIVCQVAAVSVGIVDGQAFLDLDYDEDVRAGTDMNVAMTDQGLLLEAQATAEGAPFSTLELDRMLRLAADGIECLCQLQREALLGSG